MSAELEGPCLAFVALLVADVAERAGARWASPEARRRFLDAVRHPDVVAREETLRDYRARVVAHRDRWAAYAAKEDPCSS